MEDFNVLVCKFLMFGILLFMFLELRWVFFDVFDVGDVV